MTIGLEFNNYYGGLFNLYFEFDTTSGSEYLKVLIITIEK